MSARRLIHSLASLSLVLIAACTQTPAGTEGPPAGITAVSETEAPEVVEPVVLRAGWAGSPDSLNPGVAVLTEAYVIFDMAYDSLYQYQLDGTYTLEVAESASVSEDGLVWTFTIRDGFIFHDGVPLTAKDVAFSLNYYQANADFPYLNVYTSYFASVEATDDSTVVITLSEAIPNMESQLIFLYILPEHIWSSPDVDPVEFENEAIIGSGPFKMVEYVPGESVHMEATDAHPLYSPHIDELVFQTFENQDALVQAIKTGQVDMITEMPNTSVATLRNEANVEVVSGPPSYPSVADVIFNQVLPENCPPDDGVCSGHPALLDRTVRLALSHATDKAKLIEIVLLGLGDPGLTLIPNGLGPFYNSSLVDYEFNVGTANGVLDSAGYLDADGDGIRDLPDGSRPLNFRMQYPNDSVDAPRLSELLKEMWAEIGVSVEIQALDPDTLTSVCCPAFDFDIILWGWGSDPDPGFLLSVMLTEEITTGNSETGYSNLTYDALYNQQAVELDPAARQALIWEMQRIVFDDVVYIIPYYEQTVQAFRSDRFTGWPTEAGKLALEDITSIILVEPVR